MTDDWLGYLAATLTTLSFVPQALLTLRTRDVHGISAGMYALCSRSASRCGWATAGAWATGRSSSPTR